MIAADSPEVLERFHAALDLVERIATQVSRALGFQVERDDLIAYGREGLLEAARHYDGSRGIPFRGYANYRVRGAVAASTSRPGHPVSSNSMRTPVLIAGLVATVGAAAVGTVFVLKSNSASDDAESALDQAVAQSDPSLDPSTVCGVSDRPRPCETAFALQDDKNRFRDMAMATFIVSGALGVGTAAAAWFWPRQRQAGAIALTVAPSVSGASGGVRITGTF